MDKKILEKKLRNYKITSLKILKRLSENVVVTTSKISNATTYPGEALRGQLGTLSRQGLAEKAGFDENDSPRWQLSKGIDREWLKQYLEDLNV